MTIAQFQERVSEMLEPIRHPRIAAVLALVEEVGELVQVCMASEVYAESRREDLGTEIGDVLVSLAEVSVCYGFDLEMLGNNSLDKVSKQRDGWVNAYKQRLQTLRTRWDGE